jgi:hypothetical protein
MIVPHNRERFFANAGICQPCCGFASVCPADSKRIQSHADAGYCPRALFTVNGQKPQGWESLPDGSVAPQAAPAPQPVDLTPLYHALWAEFHATPRKNALAFLAVFSLRIPGGCACRDGFRTLLDRYPPDLSSDEAWFVWKWFIHNTVSQSLGKPTITIEEAKKIHLAVGNAARNAQ